MSEAATKPVEMLVRTVDKGPTDLHSKSGDVIAIQPEGWSWSDEERTFPEWTIIRAQITDADEAEFLAVALDAEGRPFRRRKYYFDLGVIVGSPVAQAGAKEDIIDLAGSDVVPVPYLEPVP